MRRYFFQSLMSLLQAFLRPSRLSTAAPLGSYLSIQERTAHCFSSRIGHRQHHKGGTTRVRGRWWYRFHKQIGKGNWQKYQERFEKPRALESLQRLVFSSKATYRQHKKVMDFRWRFPKMLADATDADQVLNVWVQFRYKQPKPVYFSKMVLKRLVEVGGCDLGDWRFRLIAARVKHLRRRFLNLPRICLYYGHLNAQKYLEKMVQVLVRMIPKYRTDQLVLIARGFGLCSLRDSYLMGHLSRELVAREVGGLQGLGSVPTFELLRLLEAYAAMEFNHTTLTGMVCEELTRRNLDLNQWGRFLNGLAAMKVQDFGICELARWHSLKSLSKGEASPPALVKIMEGLRKLKVNDVKLMKACVAHAAQHPYDWPPECLASLLLSATPVLASPSDSATATDLKTILGELEASSSVMPSLQALSDMGNAREALARMLKLDLSAEGQKAFEARVAALKETNERFDVAQLARALSLSPVECAPSQGAWSCLMRQMHRNVIDFDPKDFVVAVRALRRMDKEFLSEMGASQIGRLLAKWSLKRFEEFSPAGWEALVSALDDSEAPFYPGPCLMKKMKETKKAESPPSRYPDEAADLAEMEAAHAEDEDLLEKDREAGGEEASPDRPEA